MNPYVPVTPEEIAQDVKECLELGASIFHIHARDVDHNPEWRKEIYENIITAIRKVSKEAIICVTTTGRRVADFEKRTDCLNAIPKPDMASLSLGSFNFRNEVSLNSPQTIEAINHAMHKKNIKPEIEIFDVGMARIAASMIADGTLQAPYYANIILGNAGTASADPLDIAAILQHLPKEVIWCAGGIGTTQLKANVIGMLYGNGVRVGLEDNLYLDNNKTPVTNSFLVERVVKIGELFDKSPYTIKETRKLLRLE
jgi:uncharacterized protein (DUF849 family)